MENNFGETLKAMRKNLGLTQKALADKLFIDQTSVSYWENGKTYPDFEKQQALAKLLNVSVNYLFNLTVESSDISVARKNALKLFQEKSLAIDDIERNLGTNFATFKCWCNGYGDYFNDKLSILADLFGVSVDYLLDRTDKNSSSLDEQLEGIDFTLYGEVRDLTDEEKQDVLDYIQYKKSKKERLPSDAYIAAHGGAVHAPEEEKTPEAAREIFRQVRNEEN